MTQLDRGYLELHIVIIQHPGFILKTHLCPDEHAQGYIEQRRNVMSVLSNIGKCFSSVLCNDTCWRRKDIRCHSLF